VTSPSGIDQQWGFPPLAATIKLFLYTLVLRKANEAIALEHIVPMRILHPAPQGTQDYTQMINMARWQHEMKYNIRRWRRDPLHIMFAPVPVGVATMGGDGRAMLTLGEVQEAEQNIMAALGIPLEFLMGGLTKAGMEATLRLVENQLQGNTDDMNGLLQWYTDKLSKLLGWERIDTNLTPLKMVDDTETKNLVVQLATGPQPMVSLTTMFDRVGLDINEEREKRLQEAVQNTLSQQVQQQLAGAQGLNYDPQAVIGKADGIAQQFAALDDGTRRSQMHALQVEDPVMYAVVVQRLQAQENAQNMQLKQQMDSMAQGGGQPPM
jgi:hypothetical protein